MMGSRYELLPRWYSSSGDKKLIVEKLRDLIPGIEPNRRGQPPRHPIKDYLILIVLKESKHASLRDAETDWSEYVCGEHVDHSVIHYWEKKLPVEIIEEVVRKAGKRLDGLLGYGFSVIDATAFGSWHNGQCGFHLLNRVREGTVYPVSVSRDTLDPVPNTVDTIIPGSGFFMGDKWYDVDGVFRTAYKKGYEPLISPQRTRGSGYWRRRGRKVYRMEWRRYRQRGRGESVFGSLTNWLGDRLHTRKRATTYLRSCVRVLCYQVRILIRIVDKGKSVCCLIIWVNS
jgi:hypothetical protein